MENAVGAFTGKLFPTGHVSDEIILNNRVFSMTVLDIGNPLVFLKAKDVGIKGTETPDEIESDHNLMYLIEMIRGQAAEMIGIVSNAKDAINQSPYVPFVAIVSEKKSYHTYNGKDVDENEIDLVSRLIFMQRMHKTYPVTSTVATGVAARIPGTVVYDVVDKSIQSEDKVVIGHPAGQIIAETTVHIKGDEIDVLKGSMYRTARVIMDGRVYIKK